MRGPVVGGIHDGRALPGRPDEAATGGSFEPPRTRSIEIGPSHGDGGGISQSASSWLSSFRRAASFQFDRESQSHQSHQSLQESQRDSDQLERSVRFARSPLPLHPLPQRPLSLLQANHVAAVAATIDPEFPFLVDATSSSLSMSAPLYSSATAAFSGSVGRIGWDAATATTNTATTIAATATDPPAVAHTLASKTMADDIVEESQHKSTYSQSLFNAVNILMGIGILTLPFAFRIAGWGLGIGFLVLFGLMTRHTACILSKCLDWVPDDDKAGIVDQSDHERRPLLAYEDAFDYTASSDTDTTMQDGKHRTNRPMLCTYGDIGEVALGQAGRTFITTVFVVELFAVCVALVILTADSLAALFPKIDVTLVKIVMVSLVFPFTLPQSLSVASYGSLLGIIGLFNLVVIVIFEGLMTTETPGSLIRPAETSIWPESWMATPLALGLIMAGFSGHSVFPNIYRDMRSPKKYYALVDQSFSITGLIYLAIAAVGYLMFGHDTMHEITQNMPRVVSFNKLLTQITVWLVAMNPVTKYPLCISPVNAQIERWIAKAYPSIYQHQYIRTTTRCIVCITASSSILAVAIVFPGFHTMMAILGSFFSFTVSVIFPELCYLCLYGKRLTVRQYLFECGVFGVGCVCAGVGTVWACLPGIDT